MNWNSNQITDLFIIWEPRKPHRISGVRLLLSIHSVFHWRVVLISCNLISQRQSKSLSANSNKNLGTFILKSTHNTGHCNSGQIRTLHSNSVDDYLHILNRRSVNDSMKFSNFISKKSCLMLCLVVGCSSRV